MTHYFPSKITFTLSLAGLILLILPLAGCSSNSQASTNIAPSTATRVDKVTTTTEVTEAVPTATEAALTATETALPPTNTPNPATNTPIPATDTPVPTSLPDQIVDDFGVEMISIPSGEFVMGSDNNQAVAAPAHKVYLDTFYIDKYEVTNEHYRACTEAGVCTTGGGVLLHREDVQQHPVMDVTWYEAQRYCEWRGGSLPTEAQWEKAARGTDERLYPWGNDPVTCERARYTECGVMTVPVGQHPKGASFYGVEDMAGNVWEWVFDWYENDYYQESPYENPTGPERETRWKSERGGAWFYEAELQTAVWRNQAPPSAHYLYVGFRCAMTP